SCRGRPGGARARSRTAPWPPGRRPRPPWPSRPPPGKSSSRAPPQIEYRAASLATAKLGREWFPLAREVSRRRLAVAGGEARVWLPVRKICERSDVRPALLADPERQEGDDPPGGAGRRLPDRADQYRPRGPVHRRLPENQPEQPHAGPDGHR